MVEEWSMNQFGDLAGLTLACFQSAKAPGVACARACPHKKNRQAPCDSQTLVPVPVPLAEKGRGQGRGTGALGDRALGHLRTRPRYSWEWCF